MVRWKEDTGVRNIENMRGGDGTVIIRDLVNEEELMGKGRMFSIITLEPGCSIGTHTHENEAEYFYIIKGNVVATDNGETRKLSAGDVLITGHNDNHSIKNSGSYTAELVALILFGDKKFE